MGLEFTQTDPTVLGKRLGCGVCHGLQHDAAVARIWFGRDLAFGPLRRDNFRLEQGSFKGAYKGYYKGSIRIL